MKPEARVQRSIVRALETMGFFVSKFDQGFRRDGSTRQTRGIPDLYAVHQGWELRLWIEVKAGSNRPTPHQEAWHQKVRAAGGTVVVAWSLEDVLEALQELGAPIAA